MVNSKGKLLKLALTLTRLSVQSRPQLLLKLSSQLSAARCTGKQVLRYNIGIGLLQQYLTNNFVHFKQQLLHTWNSEPAHRYLL